jgi:hypothetical protein
LMNRSPDRLAVVGASIFSRVFAGLRDRIDRSRDLHARVGESARLATGVRTLSRGRFRAETGETRRAASSILPWTP